MHSDRIKRGYDRAPARAMLKAVGFTDEDLRRPLMGVANTWIEIGPCNYHLRRLAAKVKEGIRAAGGTPMEFNTVSISDGITMGTEGMKASLISRELIADSIELVARGNQFDAMIALSGCDKTIPGTIMALARLDLPGLMLYGGSIAPGRFNGQDVTIQDVFEAVGAHAAGRMPADQFQALEDAACPGAGACGGQFTANTMATVSVFLGISPMGSASIPAMDPLKDQSSLRLWQIGYGHAQARSERSGCLDARVNRKRHCSQWPQPEGQQTPSCICWPLPARPACRFPSMNSIASVPAHHTWPTSSQAVDSWRRTFTRQAAFGWLPVDYGRRVYLH